MNSLFAASSTYPRERKDELIYHWYRPDRETPILPYDQLIAGYATLSGDIRSQVERKCNELLTDEELEKLRVFLLKTKGLEVVHKELSLPLDVAFLMKERPKEIFPLWEEDNYTLAFRVEAYIQREPIIVSEDIDTGVMD